MKIAIVQLSSQADVEENLAQILSMVDGAVARHAPDLIALPEYALCLTGERTAGCAGAQDLGNSAPLQRLAAFARDHRLHLHVGSVVERAADGRFYNTSLVFDPAGRLISTYRKINLFRADGIESVVHNEASLLSPGQSLETFRACGVTLGNSICYDLRFPDLYRGLREAGARVIMAPAAFTEFTGRRDWERLLRARAAETGCYIVAANQCGPFDGGRHASWGHSMIVDPTGQIIAECGTAPAVIAADIDVAKHAQLRGAIASPLS